MEQAHWHSFHSCPSLYSARPNVQTEKNAWHNFALLRQEMSLFPSRRLFSSLPDFPLFLPRFPHFLEKFSASSGLVPRGTATKKRARGEGKALENNSGHDQEKLSSSSIWPFGSDFWSISSATKEHNFKKTTSLTFLKSTRTKKKEPSRLFPCSREQKSGSKSGKRTRSRFREEGRSISVPSSFYVQRGQNAHRGWGS